MATMGEAIKRNVRIKSNSGIWHRYNYSIRRGTTVLTECGKRFAAFRAESTDQIPTGDVLCRTCFEAAGRPTKP